MVPRGARECGGASYKATPVNLFAKEEKLVVFLTKVPKGSQTSPPFQQPLLPVKSGLICFGGQVIVLRGKCREGGGRRTMLPVQPHWTYG